MTKEIWRLTKSEQIVGITALAASLIARGLALLPAYANDDYWFLVNDREDPVGVMLAQGRPGAALFRDLLRRLDAAPPASGLLSSMLLTLVLIWVGILVCRMWRIDRVPVLSGLTVLMICLHPYQAEIFTYRVAGVVLAVALGLAFYGISTCWRSKGVQIAAVFLIALALLTYQLILNYLAMALLFSLVLYLARRCGMGEPEDTDFKDSDQAPFARVFGSQVVTLILAVVCSAAVTYALPFFSGIPLGDRTALLKISGFGARAALAVTQLRLMFAVDEPILPIATKWLLVLTPVAALAVAAFRSSAGALRKVFSRRGLPFVLPFILAVAGGLPMALGIVLFLRDWSPQPRICVQVSFFWAGLFALAFLAVPPLSRRVMLGLSSLIVLSFIGANNHIFQDQVRLNLRDVALANRLIGRLEAMPDFAAAEGLVVVGTQRTDTSLKTADVSALLVEWAKLPLLNEVSGYRLQAVPAEIADKARVYCATAPKWPSPLAVTRIDSAAVVCLKN